MSRKITLRGICTGLRVAGPLDNLDVPVLHVDAAILVTVVPDQLFEQTFCVEQFREFLGLDVVGELVLELGEEFGVDPRYDLGCGDGIVAVDEREDRREVSVR